MEATIQPLHEGFAASPRVQPHEAANSILENGELPLFARRHSQNDKVFVDDDLISFHYSSTGAFAKETKNLLYAHVPDDELEAAAEEQWGGDGE